jgi:hypothetical protein
LTAEVSPRWRCRQFDSYGLLQDALRDLVSGMVANTGARSWIETEARRAARAAALQLLQE